MIKQMAIFSNQAILTYNDIEVVSNIAQGEILEALTLTKTATGSVYSQGDSVTYILNLRNAGTVPLTGLTVVDDLGGYTAGGGTVYPLTYEPDSVRYFVDGVLESPPDVQPGPPLTFTGITVNAGGITTLVYRVTVNQFAPLGADAAITNAATVSGTGITTVTAEETITAVQSPLLTITKSISPIPVAENSRVTYTFLIQNYGSEAVEADSNASVKDTFNPILTDLIVTLNGVTLVETADYSYNPASGEFVTINGRITVPAATFEQDPDTGAITVQPGTAVLVVSGIV